MRIVGAVITLCVAIVAVGIATSGSKDPVEGRETCKESICVKEMLIACRDGKARWEFEISRQDRKQIGPQQQWSYFRRLTTVGSGTPQESVVHGIGPVTLPEKLEFSQGKRTIEFGLTSDATISYELNADLVCGKRSPFTTIG